MSVGHAPGTPQWAPDMRKDEKDITEADKKDAKRRIGGSLTGEESSSGDETPGNGTDINTHAASAM